MSMISALVPAAISAIVGFGIAHLSVKRISVSTKFQKFFSYLIFISLGVGITGFLNEFLISLFVGGNVRVDKLLIFIFSNIIVLPLIFYSVIFISKKSSNKIVLDADENIGVSESSSASLVSTLGVTNQKVIVISAIVLVLGLLIGIFGKSLFITDEFKFSQCTRCTNNSGCSSLDTFKGFKVLENSVQIYMLDSEGMDRIFNLPVDDKMKCTIVKSRNNAFECSSYETGEFLVTSAQAVFDGKEKFIYNNLMRSGYNGALISDSKISCKVD